MCGIWISLGIRPDRAHLNVIAHRGPDGEGWREFETPQGSLALGHRRLAIIDTGDGGIQPMSYGEGRYWITYNGEIYNYLELREELRQSGLSFATESDTEVILAAYSLWGRAALSRLRGMFALALYDRSAGTLLLARDRYGIKPLYYHVQGRRLVAGSEIKQLLSTPGVTRSINPRRAYDFLAGGMLDHATETMFGDVVQLAPGSWLELNTTSGALSQGVWYKLPEPGSLTLSEDAAAEKFLELLQDSVNKHLRADVEVGSCLSGGLDSSALVMLMSEQLRELGSSDLLNTVTARFEGTSVDETSYADMVAQAAHAQSHAARPKPEDVLDEAREIVWHQDEPYGSTSIHAQWHVFKVARQNRLKVMLDGQGADEILAGYHGVYDLRLAELGRQWRLIAALRFASQRAQLQNVSIAAQGSLLASSLAHGGPPAMRAPLAAVAWLRRKGRAAAGVSVAPWLDVHAFGLEKPYDVFQRAVSDAGLPPPSSIGELCAALTGVGNVRMLLHWEDRNSMAHGVEARVPFLDHPLVEFAIALGGEHKLVDGWTKSILRKAMKGRLPEAVRMRRDKLGFATPEAEWMRGPLRKRFSDAVNATQRRFPEHFPSSALTAMVEDMLDGRRPMEFAPWRVACFGIWAERFGTSF